MRLAEIADIAEVIGAAAIVVSLIYVGIQVDDSTRAVRSATANETTNAIASWYETVGADQQTAQLYRRGMVDPDSLSAEEWLQFVLLGHSLMLKYQTTFYLAHEGTLDIDISRVLQLRCPLVGSYPVFSDIGNREKAFSNRSSEHTLTTSSSTVRPIAKSNPGIA